VALCFIRNCNTVFDTAYAVRKFGDSLFQILIQFIVCSLFILIGRIIMTKYFKTTEQFIDYPDVIFNIASPRLFLAAIACAETSILSEYTVSRIGFDIAVFAEPFTMISIAVESPVPVNNDKCSDWNSDVSHGSIP
jgi:hypothetical protein